MINHTLTANSLALVKSFATVLSIIVLFSITGSVRLVYANQNNELKIHFTDKEHAWLDSHSEVKVGFVSEFPPTLIVDKNGQYQGILPEYLALLSRHTGINFRIKLSATWEETITEAKNRKTDMIGMITPQKEYTPDFDFTQPHFKTHVYIFGPGNIDSPEYKLDDLVGKRIGFMGAVRVYRDFLKRHQDIEFISYDDRDSLVNALISGQVEFIIHLSPLEYWRQQNRLITFKIVGAIPELSSDVVSGVRNDWPELTSIINKVFSSTKVQQDAIVDRWLGYNNAKTESGNPIPLTEEEKSWIEEHPVIRVGFDPLWAPIEFLGEKGQPQGITIQYLRHIEKSLGLRFEFKKNQSWPEALKKLEQSQLDVLGSVSTNYSKRDLYNLTSSYLSLSKGIFSAEYEGFIEGADGLKGKRVVVVEGSSVQTWLKQNYPEIVLDSAPDISAALKIIASGKAFAFVENHLAASYYIAKSGLTQIRVVGEVAHKHNLAIAVRKDWEMLARILQKGLDTIPQTKRNAIYNDWVSIKYKQSMDLSLLWEVLVVAGFVLLLILLWNRRLAQEITHRRRVESALIQATEEAEKATQAKTEFLANMSHEIRTPMNAVIGAGHLMRQTPLTTEQVEYMDTMTSSSEALLEVINDILDFSKVEAGKLKLDRVSFNLEEVVQKVIAELEIQAVQKGLTFNWNIDPDIPETLEGDPHKLQQILRNIGVNAVKFTQQGHIEFTVDKLKSDANTVCLRFTIKDTGIGISLEKQQKLFKPFSQGDSSITREYGGTGLGLAISKQLAELMDGDISVISATGQGSSFSLEAKLGIATVQKQGLSSTAQRNLLTPIPELSGTKVLLVEDDLINQWLAKKFLVSFGINVDVAENGKKALDILQKKSFDIVLMDLQMPEVDGYEAVSIIRHEYNGNQMPVIAMTAHAISTERDKCIAAGMNDCLTKPINPEQLKYILLKWTTTKGTCLRSL